MSNVDSADLTSGLLDLNLGPGSIVAERYRLVRKIGAGGMGSVWLAQDQSLDAPCAVKLVHDDKVTNEEVRARFAREAKSSAQLRSPHVVHVFDYGESDGVLYIAMEWLEGEDLATRLDRQGPLDPATTYHFIAHVARALMSAHAAGIVHRDLKPENVFLVQSYDEEVAKVLDFGIARHDGYALHDQATRTGSFLGTPYYVSPEQARGKPIDHRADLWSLGVIAFQCLTGRPPFESDALGELMGLILYEPLPKPTALNPALPPAIDAWWERAAARDREQRFQSAKELADELAKALGLEAFVTVPPVARRRTSSFPGNDTSGIFTPFTGEFPAETTGGRASHPSDSSFLPPPPAQAEPRPADAPASSPADSLVSMVRKRLLGLHLGSLRGGARGWLAIGLPLIAILAGILVLLALRMQKPAAAPLPATIVVAAPDPALPTPSAEPAPPSAPTYLSPEMLPMEPPESSPGAGSGRARPSQRWALPPRRHVQPPGPSDPESEPAPKGPNYGI